MGKNIAQIDLDKGLRTAQSPALLAIGLGLVAVGATLAALVFANWSSDWCVAPTTMGPTHRQK